MKYNSKIFFFKLKIVHYISLCIYISLLIGKKTHENKTLFINNNYNMYH